MHIEDLNAIYRGDFGRRQRFADGGGAYASYALPSYASYAQAPGDLLSSSGWNAYMDPSQVTPTAFGTGNGLYSPAVDPSSSLFSPTTPYAGAPSGSAGLDAATQLPGGNAYTAPSTGGSQGLGALGSATAKIVNALGLGNQGNLAGLSLLAKLLGAVVPAFGGTHSGGTNAVRFAPNVPVSASGFGAHPAANPYVLHNYVNTPGNAYSAPAQHTNLPASGWAAYGQGPEQPLVGHADGGSVNDPSQAIWEYAAAPQTTMGVAARGVGPHGIAPQMQQPLSPVPQPPQPNGMPAPGPNLNPIAALTPQRPQPMAAAAPMPWQRLTPALAAVLGRAAPHYATGGTTDEHGGPSPYHYVRGAGDGTSDSIPARLADGEYVIDAQSVAMLGNGSNEAGAKKLDAFRKGLRAHKGAALARGKMAPDAKTIQAYMGGSR